MTPAIPSRFGHQVVKVARLMLQPKWWTLEELAARVGAPTQSVSARIRDLRKERWGCNRVVRVQSRPGLYLYRLETRQKLKEQLREKTAEVQS